jgi:hypothetical protein
MIDFLLLLLLFTGGTWLAGWVAVLLIAMAWGWWRRWTHPAWIAALAAAGAWGFWLALAGPPATMLLLVDRLVQILGVPGPAIYLLPPAYAALLAWAAARLVQGFRRGVVRRRSVV